MLVSFTKILTFFFLIAVLFLKISSPAFGQGYDTAAGGDSTDTSGGSGNQQTLDGSNNKAADNAGDFSTNNDFSSSNNDFSDYSDYSSNNSSNGTFADFIDALTGLGNDAGIGNFNGELGPLSNGTRNVDENGIVASIESTDAGNNCSNANCNAPVVTGLASCLGSKPVVDLTWTGDPTNIRYWHIVRAKEPNPTFAQIGSQWFTTYSYRDQVLSPNNIYYFSVFGSNSSNGIGYSARTPLSDIIAVFTPSCSPDVSAICPVIGATEKLVVSWNNNDPAASGYRLFRSVNGDISTRAFLPPSQSATTGTFTDSTVAQGTTYNYWFKSFVTIYHPAHQEVTSTDENGNPTGYQDFPAYNEDIEGPYSGMSVSKTPAVCAPPVVPSPSIVPSASIVPSPSTNVITPVVNLFLNNQPSTDLPLIVSVNTPVTIRWNVTNATGCTASSNPAQSFWTGTQNPVTGTQIADTSNEGIYTYILVCSNGSQNTSVTSKLTVSSASAPYIQTTTGDVHSNKNISVPN